MNKLNLYGLSQGKRVSFLALKAATECKYPRTHPYPAAVNLDGSAARVLSGPGRGVFWKNFRLP
jgi:hypothetical protein